MTDGMLFEPSANAGTSGDGWLDLEGETVLVTGATGFVGTAVVRRLAGCNCSLRALLRPTSPLDNLEALDIKFFQGDMRDASAVAAAMRGVRYLFHVAADYRLWSLNPCEIIDANERGTRVVMEAALAAGVERIVHTSSVATLKPCGGGKPCGEDSRLDAADAIGAYKRLKVLSETLVEQMVVERALPAVIVQPATPIGPGDIKPTPTGRIIVEAAHRRIPAFVETGLSLVHVDDVAEGHLLALKRGKVGERYILGGENVAFGTMLADIAALTSRRAPTLRVPHNAVYPPPLAAEAVARFTGREPFVSLDSLRMRASASARGRRAGSAQPPGVARCWRGWRHQGHDGRCAGRHQRETGGRGADRMQRRRRVERGLLGVGGVPRFLDNPCGEGREGDVDLPGLGRGSIEDRHRVSQPERLGVGAQRAVGRDVEMRRDLAGRDVGEIARGTAAGFGDQRLVGIGDAAHGPVCPFLDVASERLEDRLEPLGLDQVQLAARRQHPLELGQARRTDVLPSLLATLEVGGVEQAQAFDE